MKVFISQPTYLPWCGYLASVDSCDIFVVYDDVQFSHQSWQHRNKIKIQDDWMWLTVPIVRKEGQLINEVMINNSTHWKRDHWRSISQNYSQAPYFSKSHSAFFDIYAYEWEKLVDLNVSLISHLASELGIKMPKIIRSSEMETEGHKTDRLIPILKKLKADTYISGVAAKDYLDIKKFNDEGIDVKWFEYNHPIYPQKGEFIPYLSAIDLLFNTGNRAIDYIREGVNLVEAKV